MIEYEVRTWGELTPEEQLKFYFDYRHSNECNEGGETCLLGDASSEEAADAFETVLAKYAPDFAWTLRAASDYANASLELGPGKFVIHLLATGLAPERPLPLATKVSRLKGERWIDRY
jgi:hypothetical protein